MLYWSLCWYWFLFCSGGFGVVVQEVNSLLGVGFRLVALCIDEVLPAEVCVSEF